MNVKYKDILKEKGIRPSIIRLSVYTYFKENGGHHTVDFIYNELKDVLPTLSKTSIYNVLSLLVEYQLFKVVNIDQMETQYEIVSDEHSHFKCRVCNELFDIPCQHVHLNNEELNGYTIENQDLLFTGVCPKCNNKEKENE